MRSIALCGNPNCGKTTLFNLYTGARQYVGNWAGVTVEKKEGVLSHGDEEIALMDLPGIYSLAPYSPEERITRDYLLQERPDVVINVVDGTNLERNLYLTLQLMELELPMVVAVGMIDAVRSQGGEIDCARLSDMLGIPVVPVSAKTGENTKKLMDTAYKLAQNRQIGYTIPYDSSTKNALVLIAAICAQNEKNRALPLQFYASMLLEEDADAQSRVFLNTGQWEQVSIIQGEYAGKVPADQRQTMLAAARYRVAEKLCGRCERITQHPDESISRRIDDILLNKYLAIPIFLGILCFVFLVVFGPAGRHLKDGMEYLLNDVVAGGARCVLDRLAAPQWIHGLLIDAVLGGVGSVLSFTPQIVLLFAFLSLMEDSGYMARAAFLMDRLLRAIGLPGKAFIPMFMGVGCTTPAVMACRTLENEKDRRLTIMLTPFMSCGARLPIYALFCTVFFQQWQGVMIFCMYLLGMLTAVVVGFLLRHTLFGGDDAPFVMELPPYRLPALGALCKHVWEKSKGFLVKAGTLILLMSVLVWILQNYNLQLDYVQDSSQSMFAGLGHLLAPVFRPLGFGNWQAAVSILAGLVAKETVVSTLTVLCGAGGLETLFTPASAVSFMVFCLLYMPCVSAFACVRREMNSTLWAVGSAALQTGVAYLVALLIYRILVLL